MSWYQLGKLVAWVALGLFLGVFVAVGVLTVMQGVRTIGEGATLADRGERTTGEVVDHRITQSRDQDGTVTTTEEIQVEFTTADGARHRFWELGNDPKGSRVPVTYDPVDPNVATHNSATTHRWIGILYVVFGLVFIGATGWIAINWLRIGRW